MWCPKCRNEYREGIKVCADCGTPLVESLEDYDRKHSHDRVTDSEGAEEEQPQVLSRAEAAILMARQLNAAQQTPAEAAPEKNNSGAPELTPEMKQAILAQMQAEMQAKQSGKPRNYQYVDSNEQAAENRSAAYSLLIVGGIGLVCVVALFFDLVPAFHFAGASKYFICGVMGVLFLLFIVMGIVSMKSVGKLKKQAETEHSIDREMTEWCDANLTPEIIDKFCNIDAVPDESKYFAREQAIKLKIGMQFVGLDPVFLDHFTGEYYDKLFPDDDFYSGEEQTDPEAE